jgi:transcriptional regulator with XRE-family HTH domain
MTTDPKDSEQARLAAKLKETRDLLNISQQFVAEQTNIPRSAISDIERGARKVDSLELKRLAALYRFPVDYFLGLTAEPDAAVGSRIVGGAPTAEPASGDLSALLRTASELTDGDRQQMLRFALFLRGFDETHDTPTEKD